MLTVVVYTIESLGASGVLVRIGHDFVFHYLLHHRLLILLFCIMTVVMVGLPALLLAPLLLLRLVHANRIHLHDQD
jgi:hypothetical protein